MATDTPPSELTADTIHRISDDLARTLIWVILLGFTGMLVAIITIAIAAVTFIAGVSDLSRGGIDYVIAGVVFTVVAVIWTYPSRKLISYGRCIAQFRKTQSLSDLLLAINEQKAFWRFATVAIVALTIAAVVASLTRPPS